LIRVYASTFLNALTYFKITRGWQYRIRIKYLRVVVSKSFWTSLVEFTSSSRRFTNLVSQTCLIVLLIQDSVRNHASLVGVKSTETIILLCINYRCISISFADIDNIIVIIFSCVFSCSIDARSLLFLHLNACSLLAGIRGVVYIDWWGTILAMFRVLTWWQKCTHMTSSLINWQRIFQLVWLPQNRVKLLFFNLFSYLMLHIINIFCLLGLLFLNFWRSMLNISCNFGLKCFRLSLISIMIRNSFKQRVFLLSVLLIVKSWFNIEHFKRVFFHIAILKKWFVLFSLVEKTIFFCIFNFISIIVFQLCFLLKTFIFFFFIRDLISTVVFQLYILFLLLNRIFFFLLDVIILGWHY